MLSNLLPVLIAVITICALGGWREARRHPQRSVLSSMDIAVLVLLLGFSAGLIGWFGATSGERDIEYWVWLEERRLQFAAVVLIAWKAGIFAMLAGRWLRRQFYPAVNL